MTYYLKSAHGQFLSAREDKSVTQVKKEKAWEKWLFEPTGNGTIHIRGAHGYYLSARPDGYVLQVRIYTIRHPIEL
jgi:hypothetical protein